MPGRRLPCGSLRVSLGGPAASTTGSTRPRSQTMLWVGFVYRNGLRILQFWVLRSVSQEPLCEPKLLLRSLYLIWYCFDMKCVMLWLCFTITFVGRMSCQMLNGLSFRWLRMVPKLVVAKAF
jgi:hypothetical protein